MSAPAGEDLRELERDLELAAERGETVPRSAVQDRFQVSAVVADEMLNVLREHAKAFEVAPGEWRGPTMAELEEARAAVAEEPPRVRVSVPDDDGDEETRERRVERFAERLRAGSSEQVAVVAGEPTVRLTRTIAEQLSTEALGQLVKAGLTDCDEGDVFVLEVTP